ESNNANFHFIIFPYSLIQINYMERRKIEKSKTTSGISYAIYITHGDN
ncbi:22718_t:CDS:1, partial [Gigaspora rosea]